MSAADLARLLAECAEDVCRYLLPNGRRVGHEWKAGGVDGHAGDSLGVRLTGDSAGKWADFGGCEDERGDLIGLWKAARRVDVATACTEAEEWLGIVPRRNGVNGYAKPSHRAVAPAAEPDHRHPRLGTPSAVWAYRDGSGAVIGYVCRFDPAGARKEVLPQTWDGSTWNWKAFPEPRPLYGLDRLAAAPDLPVIVVEGEKCADAAAKLLSGMVAIAWPGGCKALDKVDWSPLRGRVVTLWPDADDPGKAAMQALAEKLAQPCRIVRPNGEAEGWDIADALAAGWDTAKVQAWARAHVEEWTPPSAPLEETHDLVSDYEPHPDILEPDQELERPRFGFRSAAELVAEPAPTDWLVQGWFERNTLAMYFGDPSSCKTWVALSQAVHVALGVPWFGARVQQGAVFILCGEGHRGFRRRLEGIRRYHDMLYDGVPLFVSDGPAALTEAESVRDVLTAVERLVTESGYAPALVVIDTLSRNFGGADENATSDMAHFVAACDKIRTAYGCTILVVHHSGHGDKTRGRGNSALRAALDAEFRFARDEGGAVEASCTKAKDFEAPEPRRFELVNVPLDWPPGDDGLPVNSAAIAPVGDAFIRDAFSDEPVPTGSGSGYIGPNQKKALEQLEQEFVKRMRNLKAQDRDPFSARVSIAEWRDLTGLDRKRFSEVKKALEDREMVRCDGIYVSLVNH